MSAAGAGGEEMTAAWRMTEGRCDGEVLKSGVVWLNDTQPLTGSNLNPAGDSRILQVFPAQHQFRPGGGVATEKGSSALGEWVCAT